MHACMHMLVYLSLYIYKLCQFCDLSVAILIKRGLQELTLPICLNSSTLALISHRDQLILPSGLQSLTCGILLVGDMVKVHGKVVVHEKPWKIKMEKGKRKSRRWKREFCELKIMKDFIHWCDLCWANVEFCHITETQPLEGGRVTQQVERIYGTQHSNSYGRHDIKLTVPSHGQTYLHILCWFYYHNNGQYSSWKNFRLKCRQQDLEVDHGKEGFAQRHQDGWRSYTDVHKLTLGPKGENRAQGAALRKKYHLEELEFQKKQKKGK